MSLRRGRSADAPVLGVSYRCQAPPGAPGGAPGAGAGQERLYKCTAVHAASKTWSGQALLLQEQLPPSVAASLGARFKPLQHELWCCGHVELLPWDCRGEAVQLMSGLRWLVEAREQCCWDVPADSFFCRS